MGVLYKYLCIAIVSLATMAVASHIDDAGGELTNFKFDQVVFRLKKDCSLDRQPEVSIQFLSNLPILAQKVLR